MRKTILLWLIFLCTSSSIFGQFSIGSGRGFGISRIKSANQFYRNTYFKSKIFFVEKEIALPNFAIRIQIHQQEITYNANINNAEKSYKLAGNGAALGIKNQKKINGYINFFTILNAGLLFFDKKSYYNLNNRMLSLPSSANLSASIQFGLQYPLSKRFNATFSFEDGGLFPLKRNDGIRNSNTTDFVIGANYNFDKRNKNK